MPADLNPYLATIADRHGAYIEAMAAAFLKFTDIPVDQAVLCEQMGTDGVYRFWFERKGDR